MSDSATGKKAALAATAGFAGLAAYQLLLAAGAPLGEAAWGGATEGRLPTNLRVGSAISVVVYAIAVAVILRRAGLPVPWPSRSVARMGSRVLVVLLTLGAVANFSSTSPWERFLLGPVTVLLAGTCLVVVRSPDDTRGPAAEPPRGLQGSH